MTLEQLQDNNLYRKLEQNEDKHTMMQITKLTRKHEQNFTTKEIDHLLKFEVKSSNFYCLPKIHMSKEIQHQEGQFYIHWDYTTKWFQIKAYNRWAI